MDEWRVFTRKERIRAREFDGKESLKKIHVPSGHSPQKGDMIVHHVDVPYLVPRDLFDKRYEMVGRAIVLSKGGNVA
jgi:hypothetical protein